MLTKQDILRGLEKLHRRARDNRVVVDVAIYGGAALILAFGLDRGTRDVDVVINGDVHLLRKMASSIAQEEGWPESWLNDGVKGFISSNEDLRLFEEFDAAKEGGIRILTPSPQYLFAMKCMAMRQEGMEGSHDISDIEFLSAKAEIHDAESALALIESFYPSARIMPKVLFGVQEIMERLYPEGRAGLVPQVNRGVDTSMSVVQAEHPES